MPRASDPPILLVKWYDQSKWLLERIENFPKSQRFVFGQRLADRSLVILETLVDAAWSPPGPRKAGLLARANRELEVLRWLARMAEARGLLTARQYRFACLGMEERGRMLGGWQRQMSGACRAARQAHAGNWGWFPCRSGARGGGASSRAARRQLPPRALPPPDDDERLQSTRHRKNVRRSLKIYTQQRMPMTDPRLHYFVFGAALVAVAAYVLASAADLPPSVATHFGARGAPDAWMSRHGYTLYMLAFSVAFPVFIAAAVGALPRAFPSRVNLPHRDYWLAPERRQASLDYLAAHACWLGCGMSLTAAAFHWLLVRTSRLDPPRLETDLFLLILGTSLALLAVWIVALYRRFRRPPA